METLSKLYLATFDPTFNTPMDFVAWYIYIALHVTVLEFFADAMTKDHTWADSIAKSSFTKIGRDYLLMGIQWPITIFGMFLVLFFVGVALPVIAVIKAIGRLLP